MPLSNIFNSISSYLPGNNNGMKVSANYDLAPVQASTVPLLSEVMPSSTLNMNAYMPQANYTGGGSGLGSFLNSPGFGAAVSGLGTIGNLFMGMKQYGMAKDALKEGKRQFELNYDAQKKLTNSRLADRQRARLAADPNAHMSEEEYMNQYGIK